MAEPDLSVIVPAFNEERRLPATLDALAGYLRGRARPFELIVVNDGSSDGTGRAARECAGRMPELRLIEYPSNGGKGRAVRSGLLAARAPLRLFTDADLSTPIEELPKLEAAVRDGADLAIGSRAVRESELPVPQPWMRAALGRCFNQAVRVLLGLPFRDTQCGFKLLRADRMMAVVERLVTEHFAFDCELVYRAHRSGLSVREVGVVWRDVEGSKVRPWRDGPVMLAALWKIRRRVDREEALPAPPGRAATDGSKAEGGNA